MGAWRERSSLPSIPCQRDEAVSKWPSFSIQSPPTWQPGQQEFFRLLPLNCNQEGETGLQLCLFQFTTALWLCVACCLRCPSEQQSWMKFICNGENKRNAVRIKLTMVWNHTHSVHIPPRGSSHGSCMCKGRRDARGPNQPNLWQLMATSPEVYLQVS